jgi:hypothetical protein
MTCPHRLRQIVLRSPPLQSGLEFVTGMFRRHYGSLHRSSSANTIENSLNRRYHKIRAYNQISSARLYNQGPTIDAFVKPMHVSKQPFYSGQCYPSRFKPIKSTLEWLHKHILSTSIIKIFVLVIHLRCTLDLLVRRKSDLSKAPTTMANKRFCERKVVRA